MKVFFKRLFAFISSPSNNRPNKSTEVFVGKTCHSNQQLSNVEIEFLTLLEGKRANDPTVLGWWCAFNKIDRSKIINKLCTNNYLTFADYKFNVRKATIPILKDFLKKHGLSVNGKKDEMVNRIFENICEADCSSYFTQSYWTFTPKAVKLLREEEMKAQQEYNRTVLFIRKGSYNELKRKLCPNKNEHCGTEDTFVETIEFLMKHGFEGFGLNEEIRLDMSSFVAARAIHHSSRGYSTCTEDISNYLRSIHIEFKALKLPVSLEKYVKENEIESHGEIYDIYIQFIIGRARAIAELNDYKRLGYSRIRIGTAEDARTCQECRSKRNKVYSISKAPLLPLCWDCRCFYSTL